VHNLENKVPEIKKCFMFMYGMKFCRLLSNYEGWNFNSGNYLFTTVTK